MKLCLIAAVANNDAIGKNGKLPWHIPEELKYFRDTTAGHAIVSGTRTFDDTGVLKNRLQFVVSSRPEGRSTEQVTFVGSLAEAMNRAMAAGHEKLFVIGGARLYRDAAIIADELYITRVNTVVEDADVFFPVETNPMKWKLESQSRTLGEYPLTYNFERYTRR